MPSFGARVENWALMRVLNALFWVTGRKLDTDGKTQAASVSMLAN